MDFFERQRIARRNSVWLAVLFALAVVVTAALASVVVSVIVAMWLFKMRAVRTGLLWQPGISPLVAGATVLSMLGASLYKMQALSSGGEAVAADLGGRLVDPATSDLKQRQLLNVVEEMALASGSPVPRVFVLEGEPGINAFAAGFGPGDAVVGVTRGSVELLSRDELQGVVAHEFSHMLSGDMRLNIRLVGVLHGILALAIVGRKLIETVREERPTGRGRASRATMGAVGLGAALYAVGSIGVFFGRLIKSAVTRQREYLADAAAVQFTRNPAGVAGALEKIGGLTDGSRMRSAAAEEASHMFFGDGLERLASGLLATHPPLVERIRRIDPAFDGRFPAVEALPAPVLGDVPVPDADRRVSLSPLLTPQGRLASGDVGVDPRSVTQCIGRPGPEHLEHAGALRAAIGAALVEAVRDGCGAAAVVYALLLDRRDDVRQRQLLSLAAGADASVLEELRRILPAVDGCPAAARLPLLDLALPALRTLSPQQYGRLRADVQRLVDTDGAITLFEYTLHRILLRHLDTYFLKLKPPTPQYYSLKQLQQPCSVVLSSLAYVGHAGADDATAAFVAATRELHAIDPKPVMAPRTACTVRAVHEALTRLATVASKLKPDLLGACAAAVSHDGVVTVGEAELLRAVADCLDCPMPPLLAGGA